MRGKPFVFGDFRQGLNTRDAVYQLPPSQARDLLNVVGTSHGSVKQREGTAAFAATTTNPLNSLYGAHSLSPRQMIAADPTAGVFRAISTAGVTSSLGGTAGTLRWKFVEAPANGGQGPVYGMNGTNSPIQWTGGAAVAAWTASAGTLPNGKYMVYAGNRLWAAGMTTYGAVANPGSYVVFSAIGNPRDYPASNIVGFDPGDGQDISGIGTIGPYVLVFKPGKVWVVYDLDTGANRPISKNIGCIAPDSVVETPHGTFFLHQSGVYSTNGNSVDKVSDPITPTIEGISESLLAGAVASYVDEHLYLSLSLGGAANDRLLDYDLSLKSWWLHSIAARAMTVWAPVVESRLFVADPALARVGRAFEPSVYQDYGANFSSYWTSGWMQPSSGGSLIKHRIREMRADLSGHVSFYLSKDFAGDPDFVKEFDYAGAETLFGGAGTFGGDGIYGDTPSVQQGKAPTLGTARTFSAQWRADHQHQWELQNFAMMIDDRRD